MLPKFKRESHRYYEPPHDINSNNALIKMSGEFSNSILAKNDTPSQSSQNMKQLKKQKFSRPHNVQILSKSMNQIGKFTKNYKI